MGGSFSSSPFSPSPSPCTTRLINYCKITQMERSISDNYVIFMTPVFLAMMNFCTWLPLNLLTFYHFPDFLTAPNSHSHPPKSINALQD